jgi:hypothetical protein
MGDGSSELLSQKDKIHILLQEYNTLRAELVLNGNKTFQLLSLGGALFVLIISRPPDARFWTALVAALVGVSYFSFVVMRDMRRLAKRVRELEDDINRRAGEELLIWESRWGRAVTGFIVQRAPLPSRFIGPSDR